MTEPSSPEFPGAPARLAPGAELAAPPATPRVLDVDLARTAEPLPAPVDPLLGARIEALQADTRLRVTIVIVVSVLFFLLNLAVGYFVFLAYQGDVAQMAAVPPRLSAADRLVTPAVLMTLIGATVVQTGAAFFAIVSYLFPKSGSPAPDPAAG